MNGPLSRRPWLPAALAGLLAVLVLGGGVLLSPWALALGDAQSEAPAHFWNTWSTAASLFETGPLVRQADVAWPEGVRFAVTDPVNQLIFAPALLLGGLGVSGATLGWNALHLLTILLAAFGCWRLGSRLIGRDADAAVAIGILALVVCFGDFVVRQPQMGRAEYFSAALLPLHFALLHEYLRDGGLRSGVLAGITLGLTALGGPYMGPFIALIEAPVALGVAFGTPPLQALRRLLLVAGVGVICTLPMLWALFAFPVAGTDMASASSTQGSVPLSAIRPVMRLEWLLGGGPGPDTSLAPTVGAAGKTDSILYPGLVALLLGVVGAIRRPRQVLPWLALAAWIWLLSLGARVRLGDDPNSSWTLSLPPAWLQAALPASSLVRTWSRIACLVALPVGVGAMYGAMALRSLPRWRAVLAVLAALIVADQASFAMPSAFPRARFQPQAPAALMEAAETLPEGAWLSLPVTGAARQTGPRLERFHLIWQLQHGRPVTSSPDERGDAMVAGSFIAATTVIRSVVAGQGGQAEAIQIPCIQGDVARLREAGVTGIYWADELGSDPEMRAALESALGEPAVMDDRVRVWSLDAAGSGPSCPVPMVPSMMAPGGPPQSRP